MKEFQLAIHGVQITLEWSDKLGMDEVELKVVLPGFDPKKSDYAYLLQLQDAKGGRPLVINSRRSRYSMDRDLGVGFCLAPNRPMPSPKHFMSAVDPRQKVRSLDSMLEIIEPVRLQGVWASSEKKDVVTVMGGKLRVNEDDFAKVVLKLEYWPDPEQHPDLRFTPIPPSAALPLGDTTMEVVD